MRQSPIAAALLAVSLAGPAMAADVAHGKQVFAACAYCHGVGGAGGAVGPSLKGIVGKKAAETPDFPYSAAMKASGVTWTDDTLKAFLTAPQSVVKGTRMVFPGLKKPADVDDVLAYVKTIK